MRPLVVIDDPSNGPFRLAEELEAAEREGWSVKRAWAPPGGRQVVCTGVIAGRDDARLALQVAVAGSGLVVVAGTDRPIVDQFLDELRRLGTVRHLTPGVSTPARLGPDEQALLDRLAGGLTLGEAAFELGLSRRTADRRLAAARQTLGVATTAEAVLASRARSRGPGSSPGR